jgi:hypothetical protein
MRTFGVEIEFKCGGALEGLYGSEVAEKLTRCGLNVSFERYNHSTRSYWKLVTDSSVVNGFELVSPPLRGKEGLEEVAKAMRILSQLGAFADRSCGFHVHHNAVDLTPDQLTGLIVFHTQFEPVIDWFHPPSRRSNGYCESRDYSREYGVADEIRRSKEEGEKRRIFEENYTTGAWHGSRYRKLNVYCYASYGTVEFRQHAGTLDPVKAQNWIMFTQILVEKAKCGVEITPRAKISFGELMRALRMSEATPEIAHLRSYFLNRMRKFRRAAQS